MVRVIPQFYHYSLCDPASSFLLRRWRRGVAVNGFNGWAEKLDESIGGKSFQWSVRNAWDIRGIYKAWGWGKEEDVRRIHQWSELIKTPRRCSRERIAMTENGAISCRQDSFFFSRTSISQIFPSKCRDILQKASFHPFKAAFPSFRELRKIFDKKSGIYENWISTNKGM